MDAAGLSKRAGPLALTGISIVLGLGLGLGLGLIGLGHRPIGQPVEFGLEYEWGAGDCRSHVAANGGVARGTGGAYSLPRLSTATPSRPNYLLDPQIPGSLKSSSAIYGRVKLF